MDMDGEARKEAFVELPNDVVRQIQLRLPVKSLLRFKTASDYWCSTINSLEFVKEHLDFARAARSNKHKNFLGLLIPYDYASKPCILYTEDSDGIIHARELDFPYKLFVDYDDEITVKVCNSCDGLIWFIIPGHHRILIWNPSFPKTYNIIERQTISPIDSAVMVADRTSDDYKIVKVPSQSFRDEVGILVETFSLKNNLWTSKVISKRKGVYYSTSSLIYANNGIYWIAKESYGEEEDKETRCIMYYDLGEESLDYINLPSESFWYSFLVNYKDSIAVAWQNFAGRRELRVLQDYDGMRSCWNRISGINFFDPLFFDNSSFNLNGEILFHAENGRLTKYDTKDGSRKHVAVKGNNVTYKSGRFSFYAYSYVESLVSPRQLM